MDLSLPNPKSPVYFQSSLFEKLAYRIWDWEGFTSKKRHIACNLPLSEDASLILST